MTGFTIGELIGKAEFFARAISHYTEEPWTMSTATAKRGHGQKPGCAALLLPRMEKDELFPSVAQSGPFPKKSFSIGHARDKRYYLECRKIVRDDFQQKGASVRRRRRLLSVCPVYQFFKSILTSAPRARSAERILGRSAALIALRRLSSSTKRQYVWLKASKFDIVLGLSLPIKTAKPTKAPEKKDTVR